MTLQVRLIVAAAGVLGGAGVALAALAAHVGGGAMLATAADFLMMHAAAALALAGVAPQTGRAAGPVRAGTALMLFGVVLFSGDLALRGLGGTKLLWGTAPVGGTIMIIGWMVAAVAALFAR